MTEKQTLRNGKSEAGLGRPKDVPIRFLGYANHATWEEHMEWATRGLPDDEREAMYAKYGAMRAEAEARDVTPNPPDR